jgi:hypothetical protein
MLVGGLQELPDVESLINKLNEIESQNIKMDVIKFHGNSSETLF